MTKYRSKLEERVAKNMLPTAAYESMRISYKVEHTYTPDFVDGKIVYEVKGFFRPGDTKKYIAIRDELKRQNKELHFILEKPTTPVRKGTKLTMGEWCTKNNIPWKKAV